MPTLNYRTNFAINPLIMTTFNTSILLINFFVAVDGDFGYFCGGCLGGYSVPCSQREHGGELAGDMPAVHWFLPEDQRRGGGVVHCGGAAHIHGVALRCRPTEALMNGITYTMESGHHVNFLCGMNLVFFFLFY